MAIATSNTEPTSFLKTFGQSAKGGAAREDKPKAQFWLNIGYSVEHTTAEGEETRFVSLPTGIPVDTQEPLATNSRNAEFAQFQSARNDLHDQIMELCKTLAPGEERMLNLQIQLRRVNAEAAEIPAEQNVFVRKLAL